MDDRDTNELVENEDEQPEVLQSVMETNGAASEPTNENTLTFDDVIPGIIPGGITRDTFFGKVRSCRGLSKLEIAFLVITLITLLLAISISCYQLIVGQAGADFTFSIVVLLNEIISMYYVLSGVFFERPYELGVLVVSTGAMWLYIVLNYAISIKGPYKLARLIVMSALSPPILVLGSMLAKNYHESKNLIFRTVGAKPSMQEICNTLFIFIGLLKLDLQISVSLAVLVLTSGQNLSLRDKIFLPVALIVALLMFVFGYFAARMENKVLTVVYMILWLLMPIYAGYLIVEAAKDLQDSKDDPPMEIAIYAVLFVTASGCLVMRVVLLYFGVKVFINFEKGLRQALFGPPRPPSDIQRPNELNINNAENLNNI